mgnify:CR=1 FL=1
MLLAEFVKEGTETLGALYPQKEARNIVLMLCEDVLGTKSYTHIVEPEYEVDEDKKDLLYSDLKRLTAGEPIQYVIGKAEFFGLVFNVSPSVLIPRPETELLCREAVKIGKRMFRMRIPYGKNAAPVRVLDLCTGSGCIAWTLALSIPESQVMGVDISDEALAVASSQDFSAKMKETGANKPEFIKADVLDSEQDFTAGPFDMVLSNPPYVMESEKSAMRVNVLEHEPSLALFVPDDDPLVFYRAIARWSQRFLSPGGVGMAEVNERLAKQTETLFRAAGYSHTEIIKDFYDKNRFVVYQK